MEAEALQYEYLIRTVHQCERTDTNGANADVYRQMDYAFDILSDNHWGNRVASKEDNFRNKFTAVKKYVSDALKTGVNKICYEASPEETEKLDDFIAELTPANFYDKDRLDIIISEAITIFKSNGLMV